MSQANHTDRPSMTEVLQEREGQSGLLQVLGNKPHKQAEQGQEGAA